MRHNSYQEHPKQSFILAVSKLLERGAYYGIRALLVLYMISEVFNMSAEEALKIYGWFTASLLGSGIIGAIFGDLIIGNRKSIIAGGILTTIGAFILCLPELWAIYLGIGFIVFGTGFFGPNMIAQYGKNYLNNKALLDAGFTIYYIAISVGAFLSTFTIAAVGELYTWSLGYSLAGVVMLISTLLIYSSTTQPIINNSNPMSKNNHWIFLILASFLLAIFWIAYEVYGNKTNSLIYENLSYLELAPININVHWQSFSPMFIILFGIMAIIVWTKISIRPSTKFGVGFLLSAGSVGLLSLIPSNMGQSMGILFLGSILLMSLAEIIVAPIIFSMVINNGHPKYFAIISSLIFIPNRLLTSIYAIFNEQLSTYSTESLIIIAIASILVGMSLLIFSWLYKMRNKKDFT